MDAAKIKPLTRREPEDGAPPYLGHDTFMPYVLNQTTAALNADFQQVLRSEGMTLLHWRVLAFLTETDGLGVSALGRFTGVDQATLSRALTVMEKAGYVARLPNPEDNRMVAIKIMPAGKAQFRHVLPLAWEIYVRAVHGLSMDEQETLHYLLNRIRENMTAPRSE
ncbi:MarR family winged helix-turn-helix transcriptional regulator [Pusillimonas noertemannii]|uniref:DNA-binding MarR family transcriptional regulator n=1 Tax=Pusillimonas noertemannii TaxID=305977 RepID=A0A2U1CPG1_9BURK|nr:MarR family transcriptional regulator [Pusillimonas noertemannii]NYT67112.1 MarR family transcriptional regulator [Pusillimonas noertemannii]PVY67787.1 DNA-binding MarR family transcriptional regulator [Pusillimonas noertemannii]TFL12684.1 MarR family transcriptional regulator [Pusillimonas noertemannii]